MPRKTTHRILSLVVLVLAGGLAVGWWYMAIGRFPLTGDMHHDFGTVAIVGRSSSFSHTFHLRNRRAEPVVIEHVRSGCGCTKAEASTMTVAPGETVDVDVTLSLARAGRKRTNVYLEIADFGPQTLWIQAVGHREAAALTATSSSLHLTRGAPTPLMVMAEVQSTDLAPPTPTVVAPDGVTVSFRGWKPVTARDPETARAAQWRGMFDVSLADGAAPDGAELTVALGTGPPLHVTIVGAPPGSD